MIAALFVESGGCYFALPDVDPWDELRDARLYTGPFPVVAHPPCARWGRYWGGAPRKPHQFEAGNGCFAAALKSVRQYGGVLEHPAYSLAWQAHNLPWPNTKDGWQRDIDGAWCCYVEQGHYGHFSRKPTWLYAVACTPPSLIWGKCPQRLPAYAIERYGYAKARRIGVMAAVGGKEKTNIRNATPPAFRDLLLSIAKRAA